MNLEKLEFQKEPQGFVTAEVSHLSSGNIRHTETFLILTTEHSRGEGSLFKSEISVHIIYTLVHSYGLAVHTR